MPEIQQLHNWISGDLITAERLNIINDKISSNTEQLEEKFKIDNENNIENVATYIDNIETNIRTDLSTNLNQVNQALTNNINDLSNSIKTINLKVDINDNVEVDFADPSVPQEAQVLAEGNSVVLTFNQFITKVLEKLQNKFTQIDTRLQQYETNQTTMINSLPFPKMGDIYISTVNYEMQQEGQDILKPEEGQCRCNYLTILPTPQSNQEGIYWISYGQGRTLVGAGEGTDSRNETRNFSGGSIGGEYQHLLNIDEIPSHDHSYVYRNVSIAKNTKKGSNNYGVTVNSATSINTTLTGGNQVHNNLSPYIVVYFYKRVTAGEFQQYYNLDSNFYLIQNEPEPIIE